MVGRTTWHDLGFDEACLTFSVRGPTGRSASRRGVLGLMMDDPDRVWERRDAAPTRVRAGSGNDIRAIDMRISRARRLVSAALGCDPIRTVRGVGYALVPRP
jgi:DNA-binding response OmpR family regulator